MKLKLLVLGVTAAAANAATNVTLFNFQGVSAGFPIVDNTGTPIPTGDSSWAVGTFDPAFAATLGDLDTETADQAVIDAFTPTGSPGGFSFNGLINGSVTDADGGNPNADAPAYALITYTGGPSIEALVINLGANFPTQDGAGNATLNIGRPFSHGDVAFGNPNVVPADTSGLLPAFSGFTDGITFNDTVIPEPSTGLLSLIAGLGLLARRRR